MLMVTIVIFCFSVALASPPTGGTGHSGATVSCISQSELNSEGQRHAHGYHREACSLERARWSVLLQRQQLRCG